VGTDPFTGVFASIFGPVQFPMSDPGISAPGSQTGTGTGTGTGPDGTGPGDGPLTMPKSQAPTPGSDIPLIGQIFGGAAALWSWFRGGNAADIGNAAVGAVNDSGNSSELLKLGVGVLLYGVLLVAAANLIRPGTSGDVIEAAGKAAKSGAKAAGALAE
jgi:hypothetical protein